MNHIILIMSLPTETSSIRMRIWRAVKASGAAVLRDGVYLLPERENCRQAFEAIAADVAAGGGHARLLRAEPVDGLAFAGLFDRQEHYAELLADIDKVEQALSLGDDAHSALKQLRKLRKTWSGINEIDFYPGEAQKQAEIRLQELEWRARRILAPGEPQAIDADIPRLAIEDYQGRTWASRQRPWVDRLSSAWLIRRFIDSRADIVWLESIADLPANALGFDFDGAAFSHVGSRVSFEVLQSAFSIQHPGMNRLAALVHYLDVGGIQPAEALGVESILSGLRNTISDDQQLLSAASLVFDSLLSAFATGAATE